MRRGIFKESFELVDGLFRDEVYVRSVKTSCRTGVVTYTIQFQTIVEECRFFRVGLFVLIARRSASEVSRRAVAENE